MTGPEHYREAERLAQQAATWMNADTGWKAHLTGAERLAHRVADLAEGQLHATLAAAAATVAYAADIDTSAAAQWADVIWMDDEPDDDSPTTADLFTGDELQEMERDAEYAMDAADDEAHAAIEAAEQAGESR